MSLYLANNMRDELIRAVAVKYPHTTVTGVDLFPPHDVMGPPNLKLRKDDVELPWPAQNKYELIHSRDMVLAIRDWDTLLSRAFQ